MLVVPSAEAQISPGPLSRPHADLEGPASCLQCHQRDEGVAPAKCLDCHAILADRITAGAGLHAAEGYEGCARCHIEHQGRDFDLVWWGEGGGRRIDHRLTGFRLIGAHATVDCRGCHRTRHVHEGERLREAGKDLARTWLGLSPGCVSCHVDRHGGQFPSRGCDDCHTAVAWSPALDFSHDNARFTLDGGHALIECRACHPALGEPLGTKQEREGTAGQGTTPGGVAGRDITGAGDLRFVGLDFDTCATCHIDLHRGQFAATGCESCHGLDGWSPPARFDHARTSYALTGGHRRVECWGCHRPDASFGGSAFVRYRDTPSGCNACHRDVHDGRLGDSCDRCHGTSGWQATRSGDFDHDRTRYPLKGKHLAVACERCHPDGSPLRIEGFDRCGSCHTDAHAGQLREPMGRALVDRAAAGSCGACHSVDGFVPSGFGIDEHQGSRYPLEGAHRAVACPACHQLVAVSELVALGELDPGAVAPDTESVRRFRFADLGCAACHEERHGGQLDGLLTTAGCPVCHAAAAWEEVAFDHSTTRFALDGKHATVRCVGCHARRGAGKSTGEGGGASRAAGDSTANRTSQDNATVKLGDPAFMGLSSDCHSCHDDAHRGQFEPVPGDGFCARCHTADGWDVTAFDHQGDATFVLDGAHAGVDCGECHRPEGVGEASFIRYKPVPTACEACHGAVGARGAPAR